MPTSFPGPGFDAVIFDMDGVVPRTAWTAFCRSRRRSI
jgi:beta-phosphoglucomutase-like phosphatase (HAD superfamily)